MTEPRLLTDSLTRAFDGLGEEISHARGMLAEHVRVDAQGHGGIGVLTFIRLVRTLADAVDRRGGYAWCAGGPSRGDGAGGLRRQRVGARIEFDNAGSGIAVDVST